MSAVSFDTLALARKLEAAGYPPRQAQDTAAALADVMGSDIATKQDIKDIRAELRDVENRLTIRLGSMMAVSIAIVAALVKLL